MVASHADTRPGFVVAEGVTNAKATCVVLVGYGNQFSCDDRFIILDWRRDWRYQSMSKSISEDFEPTIPTHTGCAEFTFLCLGCTTRYHVSFILEAI